MRRLQVPPARSAVRHNTPTATFRDHQRPLIFLARHEAATKWDRTDANCVVVGESFPSDEWDGKQFSEGTRRQNSRCAVLLQPDAVPGLLADHERMANE